MNIIKGIQVVGNRKTYKNFVNVQARFFASKDFCNSLGARVGDTVKLKINNVVFDAKISDYVTVPYRQVFSNKEIELIKNGLILKRKVDVIVLGIFKGSIKITPTPQLVAILSHLYSDGSITSTSIHYTNENIELIEHFKSLVSSCFPGVSFYEWNDGKMYYVQIENIKVISIISRFINRFGRKSITNPHVPRFVKDSGEYSKIWLRHAFTDEGWVNTQKKTVGLSRSVRFENQFLIKKLKWSEENSLIRKSGKRIVSLLNDKLLRLVPRNNTIDDEAMMLKRLGIQHNIYPRRRVELIDGKISASYELFIKAKDFIRIGFCCTKKQKSLESICR